MLFAADENFDNDVIRGVRRRYPELDVIRIQDTDIVGADDPTVLAWCAKENRLLLTHDARTMPKHANARIAADEPMLGVFIVDDQASIGQIIDDLLTIIGASEPEEWVNRVVHLPMK